MKRTTLLLALAAALPASAVMLNPEGLGQALIYPYYTAQSAGNDAFNTYISVVNHTSDAKAIRVRFREGRLAKETLSFNLFLSPNDVWTAAVVPTVDGARLLTTDKSCTLPAIPAAAGQAPSVDFRNFAFAGPNDDGAGAGLDRTREGFLEMIEMATLTGASAAAVTHISSGVPANCGAMLSGTPLVAAPSGGLSGTLTLINVASGLDFTLNAEALDALSQRPFYRDLTEAPVDFNAPEIDPVSIVTTAAATYRSVWSRPVDAVSAVLMRNSVMAEYTLDQATASQTDFVLTLPTRHFYASSTPVLAPFSVSQWTGACEERLIMVFWNREEQVATIANPDFATLPSQEAGIGICGATGVASINNFGLPNGSSPPGATAVLGSTARGLHGTRLGGLVITAGTAFQSGWMLIRPLTAASAVPSMTSNASSMRIDLASGQSIVGAHRIDGFPMLGFSARVFRNGTLRCDAGACQGNYGGAFPFKYRRNITPAS